MRRGGRRKKRGENDTDCLPPPLSLRGGGCRVLYSKAGFFFLRRQPCPPLGRYLLSMHIGRKRADTILFLSLSRVAISISAHKCVPHIPRTKNPFFIFPFPEIFACILQLYYRILDDRCHTQAKKPGLGYLLPSVKMDLISSWEMKGFPCRPQTLGLTGHRPARVGIYIGVETLERARPRALSV